MARPVTLVGRTELIAAIYDESNLPSAIVIAEGKRSAPFCLHSLREGNEGTFDKLVEVAKEGIPKDAEPKFALYRFFEDFPEPDYKCTGCAYNHEMINDDIRMHLIRHSDAFATKTCDECA